MASKTIEIFLKSVADATGFSKIRENAKDLTAKMGGLGDGAKKVSEAFGTMGGVVGGALQNLLKGGIWGAMAEAAKGVFMLFQKWREEAKKAEAEAVKAFDEQVRKVGDLQAAIEKSHAAAEAASNARLKKVREEVDAVNDLRKAELELERERLRKAGDAKGADAIGGRIAELDADAAAAKVAAEIDEAERRMEAARRKSQSMPRIEAEASAYAERAAAKYAEREREVRREAEESAVGDAYAVSTGYGANMAFLKATDEQRRAAGERAVGEWLKSDEGARLAESRKGAENALKSAAEARARAAQELAAAEAALANLERKADALVLREEARAAREENDAAERAAESARRKADETRRAEERAAQDAAKERDRLDRELHAKRMADLRDEMAERSKGAASLRARAAAASAEFDRAFAMYRDPARAAAEIGEETAYRADLDRLHRDARRYGGSWRIDELAALMSAGDSRGAADALAGWRKSSRFTPAVEAMVRASAAERAKTTAEDELRKIEANTAGLAEKLDELLAMKEGA